MHIATAGKMNVWMRKNFSLWRVELTDICWKDVAKLCAIRKLCSEGRNTQMEYKVKVKVHRCTGTEALYTPYGP